MLTKKEIERFYKARRAAIAQEYGHLNEKQKEAVFATEGPLLLLAGAGSGKTTVLIHRVAHLLRYGSGADTEEIPEFVTSEDVDFLETYSNAPDKAQAARMQRLCTWDAPAPWNILAITFTNKAAGELKDRLEQMLGPVALDVWASTFHSLCVKILRKDIDRLGISSQFTIYDTTDSGTVMKDVLQSMNISTEAMDPKRVLNAISRAKDNMQSPEALQEQARANSNFYEEKIAAIYAEYQTRLRSANALDFDDLIFYTVLLLQQFKEVRLFYQKKFRYVMVDEYQDTNHAQYLLTALLAGGSENICVVGDDDQSIYKFRGATIENILSFEQQYRDARVIRLEQNYRSTQIILTAANQVIANNTARKGKKLWTDRGEGTKITVYTATSGIDEAQYIARRLLEQYQETNHWSDCAILYRMNAQSQVLEEALKRNGIPYHIFGGTSFYDRAEIKDMTAYLSVIHNPSDDLRLRRILNRPARVIGAKTIDTMAQIAEREQCSLWSVLIHAKVYPELSRSEAKLRAFAGMIQAMIKLSHTVPLGELYEELLLQSGYIAMLREKKTTENRVREQNVLELKSSILTYESRMEEEGVMPTLEDFLNEISLLTTLDAEAEQEDFVSLMTVHNAKGLEFSHVFLAGMEEGIFPGIQAIGNPEEMEEARRLCYVAITRAKQSLTMTCARQRLLFGRTMNNRLSRFVEEISPDCLLHQRQQFAANQVSASDVFSQPVFQKRPDIFPSWEAGVQNAAREKNESVSRTKLRDTVARPAKQQRTVSIRLSDGDKVLHKAFGKGTILSVQQMGGDALLEIQFEEKGKKRLMAKAAMQQMKLL